MSCTIGPFYLVIFLLIQHIFIQHLLGSKHGNPLNQGLQGIPGDNPGNKPSFLMEFILPIGG